MKKAVIIFMAILLCACARQGAITSAPESGQAGKRWEMLAEKDQPDRPYRAQFSMRFGEDGDTRRVTGILWGNDDQNLRMDIMAGVGVVIGKISDNVDHFLLYAPRENKAYFHDGANKPLLRIGVPLPFDLASLAALLNGHYNAVFGTEYKNAQDGSGGNIDYDLEGSPGGTLALAPDGLPVSWIQDNGAWKMDMAYEGDLPRSLKLAGKNGKKAIVLVKEREFPAKPFTEGQMSLELPPSVQKLPLSKYKPS